VEVVFCRHLATSGPTLPKGTILVDEATQEPGQVAIYARLSSRDQKADLDRQASFATPHNLSVSGVVTEVGSGLNEAMAGL
jgi:predicted site-specific integrase-resolvase